MGVGNPGVIVSSMNGTQLDERNIPSIEVSLINSSKIPGRSVLPDNGSVHPVGIELGL